MSDVGYRFVGRLSDGGFDGHGTSKLNTSVTKVWTCENCGALVAQEARNAHNLYHADTGHFGTTGKERLMASRPIRWVIFRWHLWRMGDRWTAHSYGCDICEDR